jgi:thiol:disulfide interchange protein DsbD
MTARVRNPWHIYSQYVEPGGPIPTSINFGANPLVKLVGVVLEKGRPVTMHEQVFNVDVTYYTDSVDFVQIVKLKVPVPGAGGKEQELKTSLSGTINFMICSEEQCMPPTTVNFNLQLE